MKFNSLKTKILMLILIVVVISNGLLGGIAYTMSTEGLEDSVEKTITSVAEKVSVQIAQTNEREFHMLDVLASMSVIQDPEISTSNHTHFCKR